MKKIRFHPTAINIFWSKYFSKTENPKKSKPKFKDLLYETTSLLLIYSIVFQPLLFFAPKVSAQNNPPLVKSESAADTSLSLLHRTGNFFIKQKESLVSQIYGSDETLFEKIGGLFGGGNDSSKEEVLSKSASTNTLTAFGPKRFNRTNGAPNNYVETFTMPDNCANGIYKLTILNGESNGTNRISSAVIKLNGAEIFTQSEFNQNVYILEKPVVLAAQNTLEIRLASTPGSYLNVGVYGENCGYSDNIPPSIIITAPIDNTATTAETIALTGTAEDVGTSASGIARVLVNNVPVSYNSTTKIWGTVSVSLTAGSNVFTVKAIDNAGNEATSQVTVIRDLTNPVISISSPASGTITLNSAITIGGNASDTGADASGVSRVTVDGTDATLDLLTGNWTFENLPLSVGSNTITTAVFDRAGNQASSEINVTRVINQPPQVSAGADQTIEMPNPASLSGAATDDGYPSGSLSVSWTKISGAGDVAFSAANSLQTTAAFSASGDYVLRLSVTDGQYISSDDVSVTVYPENQAPRVFAGDDQTIELPNQAVLSGTATDDGYPFGSSLSVSWSKVSGDGIVTFANTNSANTSAEFSLPGVYVLRLTATDGRASTADEVTVTVNPANQAPVIIAGSDQIIELPAAAALAGTASDDGYPQGNSLTFTWSKVSGEGEVVFSNPNELNTNASFSQAGNYVLRFTVSDGALSSSDDVMITVHPENHAPVVSAGTDRSIALPNQAVLSGTATDDGNPPNSSLTVNWTKVSGEGTVTFANADSLATTAGFSQPGTYVLRLTATDGVLSASDDVTVTVIAANQAPVVNAGADQIVQLPDQAALSGTVTDDGLPAGSSVSVAWSKLSGPGEVVFGDANSLNTTAVFSAVGTYELKLEATDGELSAYDTVIVEVQRQGNPPTANFNVPAIGGPVGLTVHSVSSASSSFLPSNLLDENRNTRWTTLSGQNANQFVKFELSGGEQLIDGVKFQQSNVSTSVMVKDFAVRVSRTTADDGAFTTVLTGSLTTTDQLQEFALSGGAVSAKYIKFIAFNTQGNASSLSLGTMQVIGAGTADNIVSLPGKVNVAVNGSPSLLINGASITRYSSFLGDPPVGLLKAGIEDYGVWKTKTTTNEFAVIKLAGDNPHLLKGIRMGGNFTDYTNYWVKNFEIWVSSTEDEDSQFVKVLEGEKNVTEAQDFIFPGGAVPAKYIKYIPKTSRGGTSFIGTQSVQALVVDSPGIEGFSSDNPYGGWAENAFDNNNQTSWYCSSGVTTNQWIKVRLYGGEQIQRVYGVRIAGNNSIYGNFGPKDYQIKVSTTTADDSAFTIVKSGTLTTTGATQEIRFNEPVDAKYLQFYWINGYSTGWLSVTTLEVLALPSDGALMTSLSSQGDANTPPAQTLDLDQSQVGWVSVSGQNTNQSLNVRLYGGERFDINHVALKPGMLFQFGFLQTGMSPKDFDIKVSTTDEADSSFTTVFSGTLQAVEKLQHFYFPAAPARYVKLFLKNNYGHSQMGLNSFYVYAENTGATDARFYDATSDPDNDIASYQWDFGDGTTSAERNPAHTFAQQGNYTVSLTVTDSAGATNTIQKSYRAIPTLKANFSYTPPNPVETDSFQMAVYFADLSPPRLSASRGLTEIAANNNTYTITAGGFTSTMFADNGVFPATIKYGSGYGLNYRTTKNIVVQNLPPIVDISDGKTVYWGESWTNAVVSLGDPGPADRSSLRGAWNYGDGQTSTCANCTTATAQGAHSYALPGNYTAILTVTDKDGGVSSDSANYAVIKRPTAVVFQSPTRNAENTVIRGTLFDTFANLPLVGKPLQINLNGVFYNLATNESGAFETTVPLTSDSPIVNLTSFFAEDDFYRSSSSVYSIPPTGNNPPTGTPTNGGTDFWIAFPANYGTGSLTLLVTSEVNTSGTVTAAGCGVNQTFQVTARAVTRVAIPNSCQLQNSDQIQNLGIRLTAQNPVVVYGTNERSFTSDAFLALPVNTLGKEYYALTYGNTVNFAPSSQFGIVAAENNTIVTIKPKVSTGTRQQDVPYQMTLNQGQTYLLKNTETGADKDLTGSLITSDKPVAVFGGHQSATLPPPTVCCADHLVEQLPPVNTWGKRFVLIASATRAKGDFFRFVAAFDNTVIYLNGARAATINKGQFFEKLIKDSTEVISTEPILVGQYATSSGFDPATNGADPFMAIVPPYSQFLNRYTISTPSRFTNYVNLAVPTSIVGQVTLDGSPIAASNFTAIGTSGFSSAKIPIAIGTHNLEAPSPFGVFSYGYATDEGYGYPGGMSLIPTVRSANLTLSPETAAFGVNSQACVTAALKDQDNNPLGGKTVSLNIAGANQASGSGSTNVSGRFEFCYTGTNVGSDALTATSENLTATATFIWSPPNSPPTANAGDDQTIILPNTANLNGAATDDGYPINTLTSIWSKVSGSGNVTFANPNSAATTASFSADGVYVLRLTVSDGQFTTTDEVTITVSPAPPNSPPTANAGDDQTVTLNANLVKNGSAEAELTNGELPDWTEAAGTNWTRVEGETGVAPAARFGQYVLAASDDAEGELRQDIDVRAFAEGINAGTQSFEWKAFARAGLEENPDAGRIIFEYRDAANQNILATLDSGLITTSDGWRQTEDIRVPPAGTGFMRIRLLTRRNAGMTTDVFFDGLSLKAVGGGAAIKLSGAATDDGLPTGSALQKDWAKILGGGNVVFGNRNALDSSASFDTAGNYVLRLTATDGQLIATDEMTVTVNAANNAPTVNAGADQTITLPATARLNGSGADDGGVLRYRWTKASGAGLVSFSNPKISNPTVSFSLAGTYVLRLTAEDGELEAADEMTVTVNAAPTNQPPTVSAGANQTITLPTNSVTLNGVVTDDGLPNNNLTIVWSKTSGAGQVVFANPNSATTTASFDAAGSYVLRLTASDGQYTVWREIIVTVYAEGGGGGQNQAPTVNVGDDQTITLSQTAILEAQVSDDGLPVGGSFSAQWTLVSGDGAVTFSNPNQTATYANFSQVGTYVLRLTVSDSQLSASDDVTVTVVENQPAPTVEILTPADGGSITEPTNITGTVSGGTWKLEYSLTDTDNLSNRAWTQVSNGAGAASGNLGSLDTTLMLNGLYDVRLMTTDQFGQISSDIITVSVENNLKVGHFTVSFEDLNVPVAGIPMQVIRTYDSRDKRKGDFGYGWTLGIKNVRVEKNKVLGLSWYQTRSATFIPNYCVEATRPHIVTVTMPDGAVEKFEARTERQCQRAAPITETRLIFTPQAGTRGTLSVAGDNTVYVAGSVPGEVQLIAYDGTGIFDRTQFKYTSKDGTEFVINQGSGLQSVKDTNGNTLTISANGITHSSGKSISFTRDSQGRITRITDPEGVSNIYTYDASGDLVSYKDRAENTTSFTYEPTIAHHLKSIVDPLGRTPIRNEYDAAGRLLKHTDSNGSEINYIHNLAARVETVQDRLGNQTTYNYDARGNVLQKTDALGQTTSFTYDANDNVLTETDALGKTTVYTYDQFDNRTSVTDALGNRTEMTYNAKGQVLTAKDARNNTVATNTYDTAGNLLTTTDAQGNVTTNVYSIQTGQLSRTTDALNNLTRFEYVGNYLTKQTDAQNNETTFSYDNNGNRSSQTVKRTNAQGQLETITTSFEYDSLNRLTKTIQPDGSFTRTEYNSLGQQAATVDQAGQRTEFEYDTLGRLIKTTYADGKFEESTFDAEGRRLTSKDRAGRITSYEYDALGRLKKTTYSDGTFTQTNYDAAGQVLNSTDARGNTTVYTYDDAGRRLTVKNALDQMTSFAYDANGNQSSMTDALGRSTGYVYDSLNRKTRTNFADSSFTETTFDALGRRISEKDQAGKQTQFVYDSLGRLTKVKDALNQETIYGYNELGQQILQKDALNRETKYEYDRLGRRTKRILPLGQVETYSYSVQGNLQAKTDFNGKTTSFAYDSMRRLLTKTPDASLNQPTISFTYNDLGQRATMTDASGTTAYGYDVRNRLASKQTPFGRLSYAYDEAGNIETLRSSNTNGVSVDYDYDELNRLKTVKDNRLSGSQNTSYTYDAVGNLQSYSYPNQVTTSYAYNNLNRLTTMSVSNASGGLASYQYTLGASGNRTQVTEGSGRVVNYAYDDLYRLTSETIANSSNNGAISYNYDAVGNRLQRNSTVNQVANQSSTYDANDRLQSDTYDANGNTRISNGKTYNYDFENKLTSTSDGIQIVYDGDGNRVSKTVNGVTTNYLVDTNNLTGYAQVVEELQNNQVVKAYTYGLDLISQRQNSGVSFYNYDGHGSVRNLTNSAAQITDTYDYDAFGNLIAQTGNTSNSYLYAGEQFDTDLGFYYNRARYLNVQTGRFTSQDTYEGSLTDSLSLHKYLYANGDGVNKTDPSGFSTLIEQNAVVSGINIGSTYSYAPLATVSQAALAEFSASTAIATTATTATATTISAGSAVSSVLAFFGSAAFGLAVSSLSTDYKNEEENEIFYRVMSDREYYGLRPNGEITVTGTENFVSQSPEYVIQLALRHPNLYQKLVVYVMESGTRNALVSQGAINNSAANIDPTLAGLPHISTFPKRYPNIVNISGELGAITYGLRQGTVHLFNSRIKRFVGVQL